VLSLYLASVTLHVLAAVLWLGGMFFLAVVGAPVLRSVEPEALRADLFRAIGQRARLWGWISISVLILTGLVNLHYRGFLAAELWSRSEFWGSPPGRALAWKLSAVVTMIAISAMHDFVVGPRAGQPGRKLEERARLRRWAALLARGNALVGVLLVWWAVRLARGG